MPSGPRVLIDNACYHIIARATQGQKLFKEKEDFEEYLKRVQRYKRRHNFRLYGFCLMPNHVHMLGEIEEKMALSDFMHDLTRSYTAYFNEKYDKVGYLWQGRFKSKVITKDRYLLDCLHYIEVNPIRASMVNVVHEYPWSSYKERNIGITREEQLLNTLEV